MTVLSIGLYAYSAVEAQEPFIPESDSSKISQPGDSVLIDTAGPGHADVFRTDTLPRRLISPLRWIGDKLGLSKEMLAGPSWPMPRPDAVAGGDMSDWLSYHPAYDVDDGPGLGQPRYLTHWGLGSRTGEWGVDGERAHWQRLSFPQTAQFDAGVLPSFVFGRYKFSDDVEIRHDTTWHGAPRLDYTFRQGDFSDTYSEGRFRAHTDGGFGLGGEFMFLASDGRFPADDRDRRFFSLEGFGPLRGNLFWRTNWTQFRDKSFVLTPEPYTFLHPTRDDLLWNLEMSFGSFADSDARWVVGGRAQSGHQRLKASGYGLNAKDKRWEVFARSELFDWQLNATIGLEELQIDSASVERWLASAAMERHWQISPAWTAAVEITASDWDTDPPALSTVAALLADSKAPRILPSIRASRVRAAPTLFDRERPEVSYALIDASQQGILYIESGHPSLEDQWTNALSLHWGADTLSDSARFDWSISGHAAYVENYTTWEGEQITGSSPAYEHHPLMRDARVLGAAFGLHGRWFWRVHYLAHYAAKYAVDLAGERLGSYHPHKALAMLSLIVPKSGHGVDVRINAAGLWWYGDRRIDPSGYESPHVFRLDLSGSAKIKDLTISAQFQNVANFPYRTRAGYPFTGRMVRFGFHVSLFD